MLLSNTFGEVNPDGTTSPIVTRLLVWERTPTGLVKRAEVVKKDPGGIVGMPFAFVDLEGDGDLDIVTFELGAPVGYLNAGAFDSAARCLARATPHTRIASPSCSRSPTETKMA